jgi:DNA-directed RNA polymerase subunit L
MAYDIGITIDKYTPFDGSTTGKLSLIFSGKDINNKIVNALRRISSKYVPTYAFSPENILITKNTTNAFNSDMMKLRLSMLPIFNADPEIDYLHEKYWKGINYGNLSREKHSDEKYIAAFVNVTNKTTNILNVTTHDIILKIDGYTKDTYKKADPIILIKLNPNDIFTCSMTASLGIGERHDIWSAIQNGYFESENGLIKLTIETAGKLDLFNILVKACNILVHKISLIKKEINNKFSENIISIELIDEDFSLGDIINNEFQSNSNIKFSGISKPDLLKNIIVIKVSADENNVNYIYESLDNLVNKLEYVKSRFAVISK